MTKDGGCQDGIDYQLVILKALMMKKNATQRIWRFGRFL